MAETSYVLPHASDSTEGGRLFVLLPTISSDGLTPFRDKQHAMFTLLFSGIPVPCPDLVKDALKEENNKPKAALDLGSGSGAWCIGMAQHFPRAQFVGVDVAPNRLETIPSNCKFELWDINNSLSQFYGQFDLVHMRFVHGLKNHHTTMIEAEKCLKPGGLIVFLKAGPNVTEDRLTVYPPASSRMPDGSWFQRFWYLVQLGCTLRGEPVDQYIHDYDEGFWDHDGMDPITCGAAYITVPAGAWATSPDPAEAARLVEIGNFWKGNLTYIHPLLDSLLVLSGRTRKDIDHLHTRIDEEVASGRVHMSVTIRSIWGLSLAPEGVNSRPAQDGGRPSGPVAEQKEGYQLMTVFHDKASWNKNNISFTSSMNSDVKSLCEVPGFDPIEE